MLNDASGELDFVEEMLIEDSKNYHAWSYRQWYGISRLTGKRVRHTSTAAPSLTD
jgi:hypothetical protein